MTRKEAAVVLSDTRINLDKIYKCSWTLCIACEGHGVIPWHTSIGEDIDETCPFCNGSGRMKNARTYVMHSFDCPHS